MRRSSILFMITLNTLSSLGVGLLGPIYPIFIVNHFSASVVDVGILSAVSSLVAAVFKAPAGRLSDLYRREKIFFAGVMMGSICSLSYIFAFDLTHLYIIEFFFGVSFALQRPALLALMTDMSDKDKRGLFLGIFESVYDIAWAVAALLSGIVVSMFGFKLLFFICSGFQVSTGFFVLKSAKVSH